MLEKEEYCFKSLCQLLINEDFAKEMTKEEFYNSSSLTLKKTKNLKNKTILKKYDNEIQMWENAINNKQLVCKILELSTLYLIYSEML